MPITLFVGVLTLTPAVCALLAAGLGLAKRASRPLLLVPAGLGVLIPAICLLMITPELSTGAPLRLALFGGVTSVSTAFSAVYRLDAFALYTGFGLIFLILPLLLWMAWSGGVGTGQPSVDDAATPAPRVEPNWAGVAVALAVASAGLTVLFADNILWLGLMWTVLAVLVWGLGELGSEPDTMDRAGLIFMVLGPVLWSGVMAMAASTAKSWSLWDLMGRGSFSVLQVILLAVVLALAGGAYPFTVWVRRRAALITPGGLAGVALVLLPVTLAVGARTYGAAQNGSGLWPEIGQATPPITAGLAMVLLGAVTVGLTGMLALQRRDVRATIGYLVVAQVGWGLIALGMGQPGSMLGITLLLATSVFGLGAMLASAYASGTLTDDVEPDAAGAHALGTPFRPITVIAWTLGALALLGAPLFGGFVPRQMISAAALQTGGLAIPLAGLAWAGDALLALTVLRITAPAFTDLFSRNAEVAAAASPALSADDVVDEDVSDISDDKDAEDEESLEPLPTVESAADRDPRELVGLVFGLLGLIVGVAPQLLLSFGGTLTAADFSPAGAVDHALTLHPLGYTLAGSSWYPTLAWLIIAVLAILVTVLLPAGKRITRQPVLAPLAVAEGEPAVDELTGLSEPEEVWADLEPASDSALALPGGSWLLAGTDEDGLEAADETAEGDEAMLSEPDTAEETPEQAATDESEPAARSARNGAKRRQNNRSGGNA